MRRPTSPRRRGFIAVVVVVGLMILGILLGVLVRSAVSQRLALARAERRLQAEILADSAAARAAARLRAEPNYNGETWEIKASELGRRDDAVVLIRIEPVEGRADRRRIVVRADHPKEAPGRARVSKSLLVDLKRND